MACLNWCMLEILHMVRAQQRGLGADHVTEKNQFCSWDARFWRVCRKEGRRYPDVPWWLSALALGAVAFWAARISLGRVFSSSFTMVVVSFLLQGCGKAKWDVLTHPTEGTQGWEKVEAMAGVLVQLNYAHTEAPRPSPGLWRALGHGEHPSRHLNEVSQAEWWVLFWQSIWGELMGMEEGWRRWQAQGMGPAEEKGQLKNQ